MMSQVCELVALRKQKPYGDVSGSFEEVMVAAAKEDDDLVERDGLQQTRAKVGRLD